LRENWSLKSKRKGKRSRRLPGMIVISKFQPTLKEKRMKSFVKRRRESVKMSFKI